MPKRATPSANPAELFRPKLIVVFCGHATRRRPAALKQYYGDAGNHFWSVLAATNLTPRRLAPADFKLLPTFGIGLTDIFKTEEAAEAELRFGLVGRTSLRTKILEYQPRFLCFNGKQAAQEFYGTEAISYGMQADPIDSTNLYVAPSTSGAARGEWDEGLWHDLAERILRIRGPVA